LLTEKSDVYSFGVVLAELLTGKKAFSFDRPEDDRSLGVYFVSSMKDGRLLHIVEKQIKDEATVDQIKEVAYISERCLWLKREERPMMKEVEMELEGMLVMEEHRRGSSNLSSEENDNLLKVAPSVFNDEDGVGGSGINSFASDSMN
jgi:serine/threonine protein kinase